MPYHHDSQFAASLSRPLNFEQKRIFGARLELHYRSRAISPKHQRVGQELLGLLQRFKDGFLYPSQDYLAKLSGCCLRTVGEALRRFNRLGLVSWVRRIIRRGSSVRQTSNVYTLALGDAPRVARCAGRTCHGTSHVRIIDSLAREDVLAAQAANAELAKRLEARDAAKWAERKRLQAT